MNWMLVKGLACMISVGVIWTSFGIVMGKAPKKSVDVSVMLFFSSIVAMIVCGLLGLYEGLPQGCPPKEFWITFGALFVCGALNFVQLDLMSRAMKTGPNGMIWTIIQASFTMPLISGMVIFHADCTFWKISGALLIVAALVIMGLLKENQSSGSRWKIFAFLSFLSTGIAHILSNLPFYYPKAAVISSTWCSVFFALGLGAGTVIGSLLLLRKQLFVTLKSNVGNPWMWGFCITLEGFEILASIFLLYPGQRMLGTAGPGALAVATPVMVGTGLVAFEFYSLFCLREKRTPLQRLALGLALLGTGALCIN